MHQLEVAGLKVAYGEIVALWHIDLAIPAGTIFCLLGRNGSGKTTLAHAITGIHPPAAGRVLLAGEDMTAWSPERRAQHGLALVPQGRRVFPELTVAENLEVARFASGKRVRSDTPALVRELFPKLPALASRLAGTLSGGEQQMLAVGRALMAEPTVLVLDEPSLGLAPRVVEDMYLAIRRMKEERNLTMLLIEQQVAGALSVADRLGVLDDGRLATQMEVTTRTDLSTIVATYLGDVREAAST